MGDRKATPYFKGMVFLFSIFLHLLIFFGLHSILKHPPKAGGQQTTVFLNLVKPYEPKALESKTTIRADDRKSKARIKQQQPVSVVLAPETTIVDASIDSSQTEKSHVLSKTPQTPQTSTIADEMIAVTKQDIGKNRPRNSANISSGISAFAQSGNIAIKIGKRDFICSKTCDNDSGNIYLFRWKENDEDYRTDAYILHHEKHRQRYGRRRHDSEWNCKQNNKLSTLDVALPDQ